MREPVFDLFEDSRYPREYAGNDDLIRRHSIGVWRTFIDGQAKTTSASILASGWKACRGGEQRIRL